MKNKFLLALILVIGSLFELCACGDKEKIALLETSRFGNSLFPPAAPNSR